MGLQSSVLWPEINGQSARLFLSMSISQTRSRCAEGGDFSLGMAPALTACRPFSAEKGRASNLIQFQPEESEFKADDQPSFTKPTQRMSEKKRLIGLMALNTNLLLNG